MKLDTTSLRRAIEQLEDALRYCDSPLAKEDPGIGRHLRAAAIQAFEFTYELAVKTLRRFLRSTESNPAEIDELTFNELIRLGAQRGLLAAELAAWQQFRADRGATSHTYDENKADVVFDSIPALRDEAYHLLTQIERRQASTET